MPKLIFKGPLPTGDEFKDTLAAAISDSNPVDDLLALANALWDFEQSYQMSSADFYKGYKAGNLNDSLQHCFEWVATYDFFIKTKQGLEAALMRAALQPSIPEAAL